MKEAYDLFRVGVGRIADYAGIALLFWLGWQAFFGGTQPFESRAVWVGAVGLTASLSAPNPFRTVPRAVVAFVAFVLLIALIHSAGGGPGRPQFSGVFPYIAMLVFVTGCAFLLRTPARLAAFALAMTAATSVIAAQVFFDRAASGFVFVRAGSQSIPDIEQWGGLHQVGFLLVLGFGFPLAMTFAGPGWLNRAAGAVLAASLLIVAYLNESRSGLVTMLIMIGLAAALVTWNSIHRRWTIAAAATFAVGLAVTFQRWRPLIENIFGGGDWVNRVRIWRAASQIAIDHAWLGVGPGNYPLAMLDGGYHARMLSGVPTGAEQAHNLLIHMAAELGFVGGLLMLAVWCSVIHASWRVWRSGVYRALAFGLLLALSGAFIRLMADNFLDGLDTRGRSRIIVWLLLGAGSAMATIPRRENSR